MQWAFREGPVVDAYATVLFCAWPAWSRYRVVLPLRDKTLPSVAMALDRALRRFDGCPTYALTDNERAVSVELVCGVAVRNPRIVGVASGGPCHEESDLASRRPVHDISQYRVAHPSQRMP